MSEEFALKLAEEQIVVLREALLESAIENAKLKRENRRYSGALYDAMCSRTPEDPVDEWFKDIELDHTLGEARVLLTEQETG